MIPFTRRRLLTTGGAALGFLLPGRPGLAATSFALLTPEERADFARNPIADDDVDTRSLSLLESAGPGIQVASPTGSQLRSPIDFDIRLKPRNGVPVAMSSLKVEYRIGPVWTNITRRLSGHGSVIGTQLRAKGAEVPTGNHRLRLTVLDVDGRRTRALAAFSVVG